ncbi:MAG: DUF2442 domain-containing protein [Rhodothermales bacterium]
MDRSVMGSTPVFNPDDVVRGAQKMMPRVVDLEPLAGYRLRLAFADGEIRIFDVSPLLDRGIFQRLRDEAVFREAYIEAGSVEWPAGVGLHHDTLYLKSTPEENGA